MIMVAKASLYYLWLRNLLDTLCLAFATEVFHLRNSYV